MGQKSSYSDNLVQSYRKLLTSVTANKGDDKVLRLTIVITDILILHKIIQINCLKIIHCDFLDFVFSVAMMKITNLSHLFKLDNIHNWV